MAKNNTPQDPYVRQQAAIRKAKGNPNKNVHHKKNNSNYGGGDYQKAKAAQAAKKPERIKMPLWLKIFLGVLFAMLATALVLRMTEMKRNTTIIFVSFSSTCGKQWKRLVWVTQEIQDIVGSPIVKEAIINNSDVVMLLDQAKFRERFDEIKAILGLTDVDCKKIFTINRLENKEGRSFFREVFIRRGSVGAVFGVEEPHECYMTYTTERAEKEALKLYKKELQCDHQHAIEAYCRDWELSGISKSLPFAQKVNQTGHVLHLTPHNQSE